MTVVGHTESLRSAYDLIECAMGKRGDPTVRKAPFKTRLKERLEALILGLFDPIEHTLRIVAPLLCFAGAARIMDSMGIPHDHVQKLYELDFLGAYASALFIIIRVVYDLAISSFNRGGGKNDSQDS
jgi:hypothetical protein